MRFILPKLYDVRYRTRGGELDLRRMIAGDPVIDLRNARTGLFPSVPSRQRREGSLPRPRIAASRPRASAVPFGTSASPAPTSISPSDEIVFGSSPTVVAPIAPIRAVSVPQEAGVVRQRQKVPRSFVVALLIAAILVPGLAFVGSVAALKRSMLASAERAIGEIEAATAAMAAMDTDDAGAAFGNAEELFRDARAKLSSVGFGILSLVAELPISSQLTTGKALVEAGEGIAAAGAHLTRAFRMVHLFSPETLLSSLTGSSPENPQATSANFEEELRQAAGRLSAAIAALGRVDPSSVPSPYRERVEAFTRALPTLRENVSAIGDAADAIAGILGMREPRRYLVLLQNASELRPTGGFIGNLAIVTIDRGQLTKLRIEDAYLYDGQLVRYTVPPKPIQDISTAWSLHDANWFRDFPTSARAVVSFFEDTGSTTPDGVIAVNSVFFERLLHVIGPVATEDGTVFDASSFTDTLNAIGARQRPGETTQVRAVASLVPAILRKINGADATLREELFAALGDGVAQGDIQVWMREEREERLIRRLGASGELPDAPSDFLAVVHANINGFKTDRVIEDSIAHEATISSDGSIIDTVIVTRRHRGNERGEPFYRQVNKDYLRVLVPKGAQLLDASGITCDPYEPPIDYVAAGYRVHPDVERIESSISPHGCVDVGEESGRTFFGAWIFTSPGETTTARFTYRLPMRVADPIGSYSVMVVKQSGSIPKFTSRIVVDPSWQIAWHDETLAAEGDGSLVNAAEALRRHRFFGIVLRKYEK